MMSGNSLDDKNDLNYQQELSRFLHTGCSKPTNCRIMTVKNKFRFWKLAIVGN